MESKSAEEIVRERWPDALIHYCGGKYRPPRLYSVIRNRTSCKQGEQRILSQWLLSEAEAWADAAARVERGEG